MRRLSSWISGILFAIGVTAGVIGLAIPEVSTQAVSPSERECEQQGGTFDRTQGEVSCVVVTEENVGKSENSQTTTTETDTTGQGNIENKQEVTEECSGPGNSTSSAHCR